MDAVPRFVIRISDLQNSLDLHELVFRPHFLNVGYKMLFYLHILYKHLYKTHRPLFPLKESTGIWS